MSPPPSPPSPLTRQDNVPTTPDSSSSLIIDPDLFLHVPHSTSRPIRNSTSTPASLPPHPPPPDCSSTTNGKEKYLIFFIPGNPGLVSYYHTFLSLLVDAMSFHSPVSCSVSSLSSSTTGSESGPASASTSTVPECIVAGFSLGGFEVGSSPSSPLSRLGRGEGRRLSGGERKGLVSLQGPRYRLREQIELSALRLEELVAMLKGGPGSRAGGEPLLTSSSSSSSSCRVILVGHSVGAYIALEILRRHRMRRRRRRRDCKEYMFPPEGLEKDTDEATEADSGSSDDDFEIVAALLLTPTIVDIALSSSGRLLAPILRHVPAFPLLVSWAARLIGNLLPHSWLETLVSFVMGGGGGGGGGGGTPVDAVRSTISFLGSKNGVRQSLEMAADEMKEITGDGWGNEVWGVAEQTAQRLDTTDVGAGEDKGEEPAKLVLYFAQRDHWVADQTREAIIRTRGGGKGRAQAATMIVVEDEELVHGWPIRHSRQVAEKVSGWVQSIIKNGGTRATRT